MKAIVAISLNNCIGKDNKIPWHYKEDMQYFKRQTTGGTVIVGRKTYDNLPKKPLPNRTNIVLTTNQITSQDNNVVYTRANELSQILEKYKEPYWVIGGNQVYQLLWDKITEFHVTLIKDNIEGDTYFTREKLEQDFIGIETITLSDACSVMIYRRSTNE